MDAEDGAGVYAAGLKRRDIITKYEKKKGAASQILYENPYDVLASHK